MKKKLLSLMMVAALSASLVACGGGSKEEEAPAATTEETTTSDSAAPAVEVTEEAAEQAAAEVNELLAAEELDGAGIKVGFVVKSLADQYWTLVKAGAQDAADYYGAELTFIAPNSEADVQKQVENIETLTSSGVNVICIAPSNDETVLPALEAAVAAGIQVIAVDTDSSLPEKASFIGTGNESAAKEGALWAGAQVGEGAKAIVLRGRLGDATHDAREAGLKAGLEETGVEILEIQAADSTEEKGLQVSENLLEKYDQIDLIITTADSMATGAYNACQQAGNTTTKVYGFDGTVPVSELVAQGGQMIGTTAQSPYNMGILGVQQAIKLAQGGSIESRIDSGQAVVTPENAAEFVADLKAKTGE